MASRDGRGVSKCDCVVSDRYTLIVYDGRVQSRTSRRREPSLFIQRAVGSRSMRRLGFQLGFHRCSAAYVGGERGCLRRDQERSLTRRLFIALVRRRVERLGKTCGRQVATHRGKGSVRVDGE